MDGERGGVEEITCERVKGINKRTGHRGRIKDQEEGRWHKETGREGQGESGDYLRKIGFRQAG